MTSVNLAQSIKGRIDIVDYIGQHMALKRSGKYMSGLCPFHSEKTPSFMVNPENQTWRCYGSCSEGGDVFSFAMRQHGWEFREALVELGKVAGVEVHAYTESSYTTNKRHEKLHGILNLAAEGYHNILLKTDHVLKYLHERGFSDETIADWQLGYAPPGWQTATQGLQKYGYSDSDLIAAGVSKLTQDGTRLYDFMRDRLVIPTRDAKGAIIGFGGRAMNPEDRVKYLNTGQTELFHKTEVLFGLDRLQPGQREIIVVEGYLDVIQAHQAGYTNVVGQLGTSLTEDQVRRLQVSTHGSVVMAMDGDDAGQAALLRTVGVARNALDRDFVGRLGLDFYIMQLPPGEDPDSLIRHQRAVWDRLLAEKTPMATFLVNSKLDALPEDATRRQKMAVVEELIPLLVETESDVYRMENLQMLGSKVGIKAPFLLSLAAEVRNNVLVSRQETMHQEQAEAENTSNHPVLSPVQLFVLRAFIHHPVVRLKTKTAFESIGIPHLTQRDFDPPLRVVWRMLERASSKFDQPILDYVGERLDAALWEALELTHAHESDEDVVLNALYVRKLVLESQMPQVKHDYDALMPLVLESNNIQAYYDNPTAL